MQLKNLVILGSILLSGCTMHPYVRTYGLQISLPTASTATTPQFAGNLEQAIKDVDAQRFAYLDKLENRTIQRNALSGALIGLSAGALYKGITSTGGAGSRGVANFGTAAGGAYALGSYSNSPNTELAYINAANDLTCLVLRTRPWLLTTADYSSFTASVTDLGSATDALDAIFQQQVAKSGDARKFLAAHKFEKLMLHNARVTLRKANNFKGFVETAGFQLRQEAILTSNAANLEIHRLQPELVNPSGMLVSLRSTSQAFRDIKPLDVPAADTQKDQTEDPDKTSIEKQASAPAKSASAPASGAGKPAKSTPDTSSTAASELGNEADKLDKQIKDLSKSLDEQKKTNQAAAKQTKSAMDKLDKKLDEIKTAITKIKEGEEAKLTLTASSLTHQDAISLAKALSDMLAANRQVNATLTRAYSLKPYVKNIPECQPLNAQAFGFTYEPGEVTLSPGQSFDVALKGGVGVPRIWMSGAKGDDKGTMPRFSTSIDGGIARAKLELLATTPAGEMHIMAIDGSGKYSDDIKVIVEVPAKK